VVTDGIPEDQSHRLCNLIKDRTHILPSHLIYTQSPTNQNPYHQLAIKSSHPSCSSQTLIRQQEIAPNTPGRNSKHSTYPASIHFPEKDKDTSILILIFASVHYKHLCRNQEKPFRTSNSQIKQYTLHLLYQRSLT